MTKCVIDEPALHLGLLASSAKSATSGDDEHIGLLALSAKSAISGDEARSTGSSFEGEFMDEKSSTGSQMQSRFVRLLCKCCRYCCLVKRSNKEEDDSSCTFATEEASMMSSISVHTIPTDNSDGDENGDNGTKMAQRVKCVGKAATEEVDIYVRADGKRVRRVKRVVGNSPSGFQPRGLKPLGG